MTRTLERVATQTLLGIRFWDRLLNRPVVDGLHVRAQRLSDDRSRRLGRVVVGRPVPGGVIAFSGLHSAELIAIDPESQSWPAMPLPRLVAIDLVDRQHRYLPLSFVARIPPDGPGPFRGRGSWLSTPLLYPPSPAGEEPGVFLWPAPGNPAPPGRAVIHAQIVVGEEENPPPASYALVAVTQVVSSPPSGPGVGPGGSPGVGRGRSRGGGPGGRPNPGATAAVSTEPLQYAGFADKNGILALSLPYPSLPDPPNGDYPALQDQTFPLTIEVRYQNNHPTLPNSDMPDLERLLTQSEAGIGSHWNTATPPTLQTTVSLNKSLQYGQPLILRTGIGSPDAAETESFLRILPS